MRYKRFLALLISQPLESLQLPCLAVLARPVSCTAMAEVFGVISGALSIAALFNNCVDCFEYIRLGRQFGTDFERYQLRLDICRLRLSRWGQAIGVNRPGVFDTINPQGDLSVAQEILEDVADLFQSLQKKSDKYRGKAASIERSATDLSVFDPNTMAVGPQQLHSRLKTAALKRQKNSTLVKKFSWAVYDERNLGNMISELNSHISHLEKLFPAKEVARQLAELEIEEIETERELIMLADVSADLDEDLASVAKEKKSRLFVRHAAELIEVEGTGTSQFGSNWKRAENPSGVFETNTKTVTIKGGASMHVGFNFEAPPSNRP